MNAFAHEAASHHTIEPNPKEIRAHLEWLMRPTPNDEALVEIAYTDPHENSPKYARLFAWTEFDAAVEFVIARNNECRNTYVGAALRSPSAARNKRCTGADFYAATAVPVDIDKDYVATRLRLSEVCEDALVVTTGRTPTHRAQHWVRLAKPCKNAEEFARAFESLVTHVDADLKVKDAARVMRLGGTVAFPDERKRQRGQQIELTRLIIDDQAKPSAIEEIMALQPLAATGKEAGEQKPRQKGKAGEVVRAPISRKVIDGRETYWRNLVIAHLADFQKCNGVDPTADELFESAYAVFSDDLYVDNSDGRWTSEQGKRELRKRVRNTLRRLRTGELAKKHRLASIDTGIGAEEAERANEAKQSAAESWPEPLGEAAFYGLAGDVVRAFAPHTEADPIAILLQLLTAVGNAAGRDSHMQVEGDRHPPQIWPVLVGKSAKARKGTSWGRVRGLCEQADQDWAHKRIVSGLSSGEGLIWAVRDAIMEWNEKEGREVVKDSGVDDKRLLVIEPEFASALRQFERSGNTLSATLRSFWDSGSVQALTKNSPAKTTGAMVSVIGHITVDELRRYLTRTEMGNGLANRFLFACVRRSKELPFGGDKVDTRWYATRIGGLLSRLQDRGDTAITWDEPAARLWGKVYSELSRDRNGLTGAVASRAEAQVVRLALTYALLDEAGAIGVPHLEAGLAVWKYCEESVAVIFGSSTGDPLADEINQLLKASPGGLTRAALFDLLGRHRSRDEIGRALALLLTAGLVRSETRPTRGRPEERWFAL